MNRISTNQTLLAKSLVGLIVAITLLLLARPMMTGAKNSNKQRPKTASPSEAKPSVAASGEVAQQINSTIENGEFAYARWGICVISLTDGAVVYQRDADKLFTPASNMKIYTTGVALDLLGADYRWRTSVYTSAQPDAGGRIHGDLILYGRGAPDLIANSNDGSKGSLSGLADQLYQKGIRRIDGKVIGDESYFRGDPLGDGWQWTDLQWYFGAEASALSVNGNEVDVNIVPSGKGSEAPVVKISNALANVVVQNRMALADKEGRPTVGLHRGLSDNNLEVWGEFTPASKGFGARLSVHDPALWAARLFVEALKARGIAVGGEAQSRNARAAQNVRFDPGKASELAFVTSQPLSEIAKKTNKESINLNAELILRTLGRERGEMIAGPEPAGRERGDDEAGLAVVRLWLSRAAVPSAHIALHDGSGLSRLDLVTPETSARLLIAMSKTAAAAAFKESLPIAGRDGTLAGRLRNLSDRVWAKTGSLTYDNSLSGYMITAKGEVLAFSIMCNDQTGRDASIRLIDQILTLMAGPTASSAEKSQKP
ncbi:MAG TPA: D-alanyl-D-alanine carboxypeptidase/D-alanyl-D-alanine-endopeptidase [Pyrinomonadaceae bacterium]|nr:D-alanyl-D-alanine carboxypeptidase/D-alanyl-D-alanine-endopeptidase [Pyrinomonadaceae bacterium]